jgi:2-dehydropantoate 2-reductase
LNFGVIGVGGVGGYFGGKLCGPLQARGNQVFFVARGGHLDEIRKNGLLLSTEDQGDTICRPTLATNDFYDIPVLDVCLICVKSYDLPAILAGVAPKISNSTLILPLLNGVDIYERVRQVVKTGVVFPACVYVGTHIERHGRVVQRGGACRILLGPDPSSSRFVPSLLFDTFDLAEIRYQWFEDVYPEIWTKFIFIAAFGLVTAAFDRTLGEVREDGTPRKYVASVMGEIQAIASSHGVRLPENIIAESLRKADGFPGETKTSFQRDVERSDKPDERDLFGGTVIRFGRALDIETPVTSELQGMLNVRKAERP